MFRITEGAYLAGEAVGYPISLKLGVITKQNVFHQPTLPQVDRCLLELPNPGNTYLLELSNPRKKYLRQLPNPRDMYLLYCLVLAADVC
jgi:hypothetical protein